MIHNPGSFITCPKCCKISYNKHDIENKYCGNCHEYHDTMVVIPGAPMYSLFELLMDSEHTPAELSGMSREELRFYRIIEECEVNDDGVAEVTLGCGHTAVWIAPPPNGTQYALCSQCFNAWLAAESKDVEAT